MKTKKVLSLVLAIAIITVSLTIMKVDDPVIKHIAKAFSVSDIDKKMANDIADMSGLSVNEILRIKSSKENWNGVIESIKTGSYLEESYGLISEKMSDEKFQEKLDYRNFSDDEINEAKSLIEQFIFNLSEVIRNDIHNSVSANPETVTLEKDRDDIEKYSRLEKAFDKNKAVYLTLSLKNQFGSIHIVLDEYIYSLQIEVDLEIALNARDEYDKQVLEKAMNLSREKAISISVIEEKMLEALQGNKDSLMLNNSPTLVNDFENELKKHNLDMSGTNSANDIRPRDPTADIQDEINMINNRINR